MDRCRKNSSHTVSAGLIRTFRLCPHIIRNHYLGLDVIRLRGFINLLIIALEFWLLWDIAGPQKSLPSIRRYMYHTPVKAMS